MLRQFPLNRSRKIAIQQHRWVIYKCALMYVKCEQSSNSSSADNDKGCEGTFKHIIKFHPVVPKYIANLSLIENYVAQFHTYLDITAVSYSSELVTMKRYIFNQTGRHFFLPVWPLQHHMCLASGLLSNVRSLHSCTNGQDLTEADVNDNAPTGAVSDKVLTEEPITEPSGSRATFTKIGEPHLTNLATILHCSVDEMKNIATKHIFFNHLAPKLIQTKLNVMVSYGLPYSLVSKHPRILYYTSADELDHRLQKFKAHSFLKENSVVTLENLAYYLECRNELFACGFTKLRAEKDALEGCKDRLEYIQFRLKVSEKIAEKLLSSYPLERGFSNSRIKRLLDFFLNEAELSAQFVINNRRLMSFSAKRLQARWKVIEAEAVTSEPMMLRIWNMSQKEFDAVYGNLCKHS